MLFYTKYNYKFKVEKSLTIKLPFTFNNFTHPYIKLINGNLTINIGYAWDGASGPVINTKNTLIASCERKMLNYRQVLHFHNTTSEYIFEGFSLTGLL